MEARPFGRALVSVMTTRQGFDNSGERLFILCLFGSLLWFGFVNNLVPFLCTFDDLVCVLG